MNFYLFKIQQDKVIKPVIEERREKERTHTNNMSYYNNKQLQHLPNEFDDVRNNACNVRRMLQTILSNSFFEYNYSK